MDLLTKFASIEIKPDARISEADRTFCQAHQAAYDAAKESLQELEFFWEDIQRQQQEVLEPVGMPSESYFSTYGKLDLSGNDIREQRRSLHPVFIHNLAAYFNDTYHLSIKAEDIKENLLPQKPSYSFPQDYRQKNTPLPWTASHSITRKSWSKSSSRLADRSWRRQPSTI